MGSGSATSSPPACARRRRSSRSRSSPSQHRPNKRPRGGGFRATFYSLTNPPMVARGGPLILDLRLQPVWFKPVPVDDVAGNLSLQLLDGKPVLTWWQGVITNTGATETGEDVIVDQHYRPVATLHATGGWVLTLHEMVIRGHTAWVTANKNIP